MFSIPPDARLMQSPGGLLNTAGYQEAHIPERKTRIVQVACGLSIVGGQGYGSLCGGIEGQLWA